MSSKQEIYADTKPIYAEVVLRSKTPNFSLIKRPLYKDKSSLNLYKANPTAIAEAQKILAEKGFKVIASSPFQISIVGEKEKYEEHFKTDIMFSFIKDHKKKTEEDMQFIIKKEGEGLAIPDDLKNLVETVYVPPVVRFHDMYHPTYPHLEPPKDIVSLLKADIPYSNNIRGAGVIVAMVDSGLVKQHEYYTVLQPNYNITVHGNLPLDDSIGHGTGMAANLLAIAPDCTFHLFKTDTGTANFPALAALSNAMNLPGVKVISNSWGCDYDPLIEALVIDAVKQQGITVVFSVGNKGYPENAAFPSCMEEVISVGGAYFDDRHNRLTASNFAQSGCNSHPNYVNRQCPDVCGLCGEKPRGKYIVMPTQKKSFTDDAMSRDIGPRDRGDGSPPDDGWFVGSGTSAAAAQVAGGAALLLSKNKNLKPADIKNILETTAADVAYGRSATNQRASPGKDEATGYGLINLDAAVSKA